MAKLWTRFVKAITSSKRNKKIALVGVLALLILAVPMAFAFAEDPPSTVDVLLGASNPITFLLTALAVVYSVIAWMIGKLIVLTLTVIIIPILGYNNFGDSNLISIGWPLVRDIVNMFVVIIILYIAIRTMLGFGKGQGWQQQLPKLFLAVIAVNFSRTICVLMIDVGQVIMMTFVNALRDIAAGNFVALFQLDSMMGVDPSAVYSSLGGNGGLNSYGYLASTYAVVILLGLVLATLLLLAGIFIYRIVMLWILVIMSPLVFFLGGVREIIGSGASNYAEWWKKFVGCVTLGPIMTFFLWLGLAAASQGSIAATENFEQPPGDATTYGFVNEIFQVEKILSLFIGYMIIVVGFQASSSAAGAVGGVFSQYFSEKGGMGLLKTMAKAPVALPLRVGREAGTRVGVPLAQQIERRTGIGASIGKTLGQTAGQLQRQGGFVGSLAGGVLGRGAASIESAAGSVESEGRKAAKENVPKLTQTQRTAMAESLAKPDSINEENRALTLDQQGMDNLQEYAVKISTDSDFAAGEKRALIEEHGDDEGTRRFDLAKENATRAILKDPETFIGDDEKRRRSFEKLQEKNIPVQFDLIAEKGRKAGWSTGKVEEEQEKWARKNITDNKDFDTRNLSVAAVQNTIVETALKKKRVKTDKNGNPITAWENAEKGINVNSEVRDHFDNIRTANSKEASIKSEAESAAQAAATAAKANPETANAKDLAEAMRGGVLQVGSITAEHLTGENKENVTMAMIDSGQPLDGLSAEVAEKFVEAANALRAVQTVPAAQRKIDVALYSATGDKKHIGVNDDGSIESGQALVVTQVIKSNPTVMNNFTQQVSGPANAFTQQATNQIGKKEIDQILYEYQHAASKEIEKQFFVAAINTKKALQAELARPGQTASKQKEIRQKIEHVKLAEDLMG